MPDKIMPYKVIHKRMAEVRNGRKRGRPRKRWLQSVIEDVKEMSISKWGEKVIDIN